MNTKPAEGSIPGLRIDTTPRTPMPREGGLPTTGMMIPTLLPTSQTQCMLAHPEGRQDHPELAHQGSHVETRETREEPGAAGPTRCLRCQEGGQAEAQARTEEGTSRGQGIQIIPLRGGRIIAATETGEDKPTREKRSDFT